MRRATVSAVPARKMSWFTSIHFVAVHDEIVRRSRKS